MSCFLICIMDINCSGRAREAPCVRGSTAVCLCKGTPFHYVLYGAWGCIRMQSPTLYLLCKGIARPAPPICLPKEIHKPLALSRVFLLSSGGKSVIRVKKKALSLSGFSTSTHVVLKDQARKSKKSTYVDIRATYVVRTYLPLVHPHLHESATPRPIAVRGTEPYIGR